MNNTIQLFTNALFLKLDRRLEGIEICLRIFVEFSFQVGTLK